MVIFDHLCALLLTTTTTTGRSNELGAQQHGPEQQHGQHRSLRTPMATGLPARGETCPLPNKSPPQRATPLPHTTESHGDACSVSNRPRNSPVWSGWSRGPDSGRELPIPSPRSVWGSRGSLSRWWRWRPTIPWRQPRWISLWHSKHSKPPDGLDLHNMECDLPSESRNTGPTDYQREIKET